MPELNSKKGRRPPVLDPFEVRPGWFLEIALPHLHLRVTSAIPASHRELAQATLLDKGLGLSGQRLMRLHHHYMQHSPNRKTETSS